MGSKGKEMEIAIKIAGKVASSFKGALGAATKGIGRLGGKVAEVSGKSVKAIPKGIGAVAKTVSAATAAAAAAVGAIGTAAIKTGAEFEKSMSQVSATMLIDKDTKKGAAQFNVLEEAARKCGRETAFSATEAAEALNNLAMAGYGATDAATALPTVLNLAGAGGLQLADSARYLTAGLASLGIDKTEDNFNHFADILAITASKAKTDVAQIGDAITTLGGTGKGLKGGTEEIAAALGILADADITGSEGGTHLRNMILSLQNPRNSDAAKMFDKLGLEAYDKATGKMRGLNEIFKDLDTSMKGMTDKQKNNIMSTIFKQTDLAAANALIADCGDRFDELYQAASSSSEGIGAAAKMYAKQMDNLNGDIDILKSGLSDLGISIYKDVNSPLRDMVQFATKMVSQLSSAYDKGGMEGMVKATGSCLSEVVNTAMKYAPKVTSLGINLLENFIDGITKNSGKTADAASRVLSVFTEGIFKLVPKVITAGADLVLQFAQSITKELPQLITSGTQAVSNLADGIVSRLPEFVQTAVKFIEALVTGLVQNAPELALAGMKLLSGLADAIKSLLPQLAPTGSEIITQLVQSVISGLPKLVNAGTNVITNIVNGITQYLPIVIQTAFTLIQTLAASLVQNAPKLLSAAIQLIGGLVAGFMQMVPQLMQTGIQLINGLTQGIQSSLPGLIPSAMQALVTFSGTLRTNAGKLVDAGLNMVMTLAQSLIDNIPVFIQTIPAIVTNIAGIINDNAPKLLSAGIQLIIKLLGGIIQAVPVILANIPQIIQAVVSVFMAFNWMALGSKVITFIGNGIRTAITSIPQIFSNFVQTAHNIISTFNWRALGSGIITTIGNGIKNMITSIPKIFLDIGKFAVNAIKSINWWDVGVAIIKLIGTAISGAGGFIIDAIKGIGGSIIDGIKGIFSGDDDDEEASSGGAAAAQSYAEGISNAASDASNAANSMASAAFSSFDTASASAAGTQAGAAFSTGLADSMAANSPDITAFNTNMADMGAAGADALSNGFNTSLAETDINIAGTAIETSGINAAFTDAGISGADALNAGITENSQAVTQAAETLGSGVNTALDNEWEKVNANAQTAMQKLAGIVTNAARSAVNAVKTAFRNMDITIPKPKLPVITVNYKTEKYGKGGNVKVPDFNVAWNAAGGIFDRPTILNTSAGLQGVGEAGPEAVLPLDTLWAKMTDILNDHATIRDRNSVFDALLEKLKNTGNKNRRNRPELEGAGGINIQYSPVFNLYGSTSKEDVREAGRTGLKEFKKLMKQYEKDLKRDSL